MSDPTRKKMSRKKSSSELSNSVVTDFIDNSDPAEPKPKKPKRHNPDDSLKFFKPTKPKKARPEPEPSTSSSSSSVVSNFINQPSTSKKTPAKTNTKKPSKRKPKAQPDIRNVLSKQEQMFNYVISENCLQEGIDPEEMQLALAISNSLRDQSQLDEEEASSSSSTSKFENPFTSMNKVQAISAKLERYGFKSKTNYTEYELDLISNTKITKRSKFQKFPTALTRMTNEKRNENIRHKVEHIMDHNLSEPFCIGEESKYYYEVFSPYLQEFEEKFQNVFSTSSEDRPTEDVLLKYYVNELFEPSFVPAGHMLKDWSKIPGREPTPDRNGNAKDSEAELVTRAESNVTADDEPQFQAEVQETIECDAIDNFESLKTQKSDNIDENNDFSQASPDIEALLDRLEANAAEPEKQDKNDSKGIEIVISSAESESESNILNPPKNVQCALAESCLDIFADLDDSGDDCTITEVSVKETSGELAMKLEELQEKLSQSMMEIDETDDDELVIPEVEAITVENEPEASPTKPNKSLQSFVVDEIEQIDLTQRESSMESSNTIPYDDSYLSLQAFMKKTEKLSMDSISETEEPAAGNAQATEVEINLLTSDEDSQQTDKPTENEEFEDDVEDTTPMLSQNSIDDDDDIIAISDEEINYSTRRHFSRHNTSSELSDVPGVSNEKLIDLTQCALNEDVEENIEYDDDPVEDDPYPIIDITQQFEIENIADRSLADVMEREEEINIDLTISNLLETTAPLSNLNNSAKDRSMKAHENNFSDSIMDIMKRYGLSSQEKENSRSLKKMQSDSMLRTETPRKRSFRFSTEDNVVDLTQPLDAEESLKENSFFDRSIHNSIENILSYSPVVSRKKIQHHEKTKKSLGVQVDDDYIVDTESVVPEPDFKNMTPVELKQALFKFGVRPLPTKKAISLLEFIYDQLHPTIRAAADEEIDVNDSRRAMNITDIVSNIGVQDSDDFVFEIGLVEGEEFVLPKMRKSKHPTCLIPLHISFYNMVRSSEKLQNFILEFRPIELDRIHKHFRKFSLSYQPNDIIAFLDRRCITFKTKEQASSKIHERKIKKRVQKSQASQRTQK